MGRDPPPSGSRPPLPSIKYRVIQPRFDSPIPRDVGIPACLGPNMEHDYLYLEALERF
ncbi:uncharacterized protein G2W53_041108 [Senna tora]|uniref:Uncharacterized protein n=1 Tax=Senna tora TaxID=362788 RepID=A0A834VYG7_9FABA|nr:uncharacterized protein G2W53_041108 [Senna tora]